MFSCLPTHQGARGHSLIALLPCREKQYVSTAEMRLTSIDQDELDVPDMEYSSAVAMGSQDFLRICREMSAIPGMDTLKISLDSEDDGVVLSGNCDIGSLTYEITSPPDNESQHEEAAGEEGKPGGMHIIRSRGEYSETFGLRYLVTFAKAAQLCSNLTVSEGLLQQSAGHLAHEPASAGCPCACASSAIRRTWPLLWWQTRPHSTRGPTGVLS